VNTSGDGFLAMFDGSQRAIRCAMAIRDAVQALGIEVRAGLHSLEFEERGAHELKGVRSDPVAPPTPVSWADGAARRARRVGRSPPDQTQDPACLRTYFRMVAGSADTVSDRAAVLFADLCSEGQ
jgi:hypothetical protein